MLAPSALLRLGCPPNAVAARTSIELNFAEMFAEDTSDHLAAEVRLAPLEHRLELRIIANAPDPSYMFLGCDVP
jgi:hypothetical protein